VKVTLAVAQILEQLAAQLREKGLAVLGDRLAHVARQPNPLTPMITTNVAALMTQQDLAAYLGCNVRTLRRWGHEGRIPHPISIGRVQRWRRADVDRWLEDGRG
jgi:excisionase family DNA binding protein